MIFGYFTYRISVFIACSCLLFSMVIHDFSDGFTSTQSLEDKPLANAIKTRDLAPAWISIEIIDTQNRTRDTLCFCQDATGVKYCRSSVGQLSCDVASGEIVSDIVLEDVFSEVGNIQHVPAGQFILKCQFCNSFGTYTERQSNTTSTQFQNDSARYPKLFSLIDRSLFGPKAARGFSWFLTHKQGLSGRKRDRPSKE